MTDPIALARRIQSSAADPRASVVLEAAAGAGKTKVLVDRYLRLCLGGSGPSLDPRAILAITFTRRATTEIQARLQGQARRLAALTAGRRSELLTDLLDRPPTAAEIARAAWFFETLLEDPVGLGIETMHAFCQRVLGRFAAEAGLDPRLTVLEGQAEQVYHAEALDRLELELAADPAAAAAQAALADTAAGARARVADLFARRLYLQRWVDRVCPPAMAVTGGLSRPLLPCLEALLADLRAALLRDLPSATGPALDDHAGAADETARRTGLAAALGAALQHLRQDGLMALAAADGGEPTPGLRCQLEEWDQECQAACARLAADPQTLPDVVAAIQECLLTGSGQLRAVKGRQQTKSARQAIFAAAAAPVLQLSRQAGLFDLLAANGALLRHGLRALDIYADLKRRDRVVDFQDLECLARSLLLDPRLRPQVHFRLDARLEHMLLDEFQDTNRNQWDLLRPLLDEVLAGDMPPRTVLVVGDVKQSIYGFRGAEPAVFGAARELVRRQVGPAAVRQLPTNFRSLPAIVDGVGALFQAQPLADLLGEAAAGVRQEAARTAAAGQIVCVQPFRRVGSESGHQRAAAAVVALIERLLQGGFATWAPDPVATGERARALSCEDILILTRNKTHLAVYEAALRRAGIPFTPAGRGLLARCREVQDVLALLRWLTYPADDTAGAAVLRSPLCRLPETQVQALLAARNAGRPGVQRRSLREVLQNATACAPAAAAGHLLAWFPLAGLLPLHDLLRHIYREAEVLERFEIAHGEQARFNLLRLLDLALAAETRGGSLRDFVAELEQAVRLGGQEEAAPPAAAGGGRVRVMTVHGAKGLQAPVVILADAAAPLREKTESLLLAEDAAVDPAGGQAGEPEAALADGPWVHGVRKEHYEAAVLPDAGSLPGPLAAPRRRAARRLLAEEAHILYVAMTRARDRLFVLGGCNDRQTEAETARSHLGWLAQAAAAVRTGLVWRDADAFLADPLPLDPARGRDTIVPNAPVAEREAAAGRLVVWEPPPIVPRLQIVSPSQLDDDRELHIRFAVAAGGDLERAALADSAAAEPAATTSCSHDNPATRRGTRVHAWLERACLLGELPPPPREAVLRADWEEARAVWTDPALAWIFLPDNDAVRGFCEVPILHGLTGAGGERRCRGVIDRLLIGPGRLDIIDYKTNRIEPGQVEAAAAGYRSQLLAYRQALSALCQDQDVRCWLLWTAPALASCRLSEVRP